MSLSPLSLKSPVHRISSFFLVRRRCVAVTKAYLTVSRAFHLNHVPEDARLIDFRQTLSRDLFQNTWVCATRDI